MPFRPALLAGSLRIDHSQRERQPPSRNRLHPGLGKGWRTGAVTPELLPSARLSRPRFGLLPGSEPPAHIRPVLGLCTTQFIVSATLKARSVNRLARPALGYEDCCSNVGLPRERLGDAQPWNAWGWAGEQRLVLAMRETDERGQAICPSSRLEMVERALAHRSDACGQLARIP